MDPDKSTQMATGSSSSEGQVMKRTAVVDAAFAGRVGGNQEFIATPNDSSLLNKQPDAAPLQSVSASFKLNSFADSGLWRMAFLEGWGTMLLTFLLGGAAIGLTAAGQSPFATTLYASLANWLALSVFILCLGPVSGGHLNPSITLGTFFAGLSTFPRAVLYIAAQSIGAIVAGFLLKLGVGSNNYFASGIIPGCTVDTTMVSVGQMFALELMFGMAAIFMAFGVGLDPRQSNIYGPAFAPVLVGITLALNTLCSAMLRPGYTGASEMSWLDDRKIRAAKSLGTLGGTADGYLSAWPPVTFRVSFVFTVTALGVQHRLTKTKSSIVDMMVGEVRGHCSIAQAFESFYLFAEDRRGKKALLEKTKERTVCLIC